MTATGSTRRARVASAWILALAVVGCTQLPSASPSGSRNPPASVEPTTTPAASIEPSVAPPSPSAEPVDVEVAAAEDALDELIIDAATGADFFQNAPPESDFVRFVEYVATQVDEFWRAAFTAAGAAYRSPQLYVIDQVQTTACGDISPVQGPGYCAPSSSLFVPLPYLSALTFDEPGDFSLAYVIAHEMGHHVQNVAGIKELAEARSLEIESELGAASPELQQMHIAYELQADCFAGVWAHSASSAGQLDLGDLEEAQQVAWATGDDALGNDPATWVHGSSQQRFDWLSIGFNSGSVADCKTFSTGVTPLPRATTINKQRLARQFVAIGTSCQLSASEDGSDPLAVAVCQPVEDPRSLNVSVHGVFSYWSTASRMQAEVQSVIAANPGAAVSPWWYTADPSTAVGTVVQWTDVNGLPWIMWTVDGSNMTGIAVSVIFTDAAYLYEWWAAVGTLSR